jgi:hypothetical protein
MLQSSQRPTTKTNDWFMSLYVFPSNPAGFSSHINVIIWFLQSTGASPKSSFLYPRSKGLTEQALAELGYNDTVVFRPAALSNTNRTEFRLAENALLYAPSPFSPYSLPAFPIVVCHQ